MAEVKIEEKSEYSASCTEKQLVPCKSTAKEVFKKFELSLFGTSPAGIRSFRPKGGSPNSSSPKLSRFSRSVFVVLQAPRKGVSMERQ